MIQLSYMVWMDSERQYNEWLKEREKKRREEEEKNKKMSMKTGKDEESV